MKLSVRCRLGWHRWRFVWLEHHSEDGCSVQVNCRFRCTRCGFDGFPRWEWDGVRVLNYQDK